MNLNSKYLILLVTMLLASFVFSQNSKIGIGTTTPMVTLEVVSDPADISAKDAISFPVLSGVELAAKESAYLAANEGVIVFVTSAAPDLLNPVFSNVNDLGLYQYDGTQWLKIESFLTSVFIPRLVGTAEAFTSAEFDLPDGAPSVLLGSVFTTTGDGFDTNGRFTAPVDGLYKFFFQNTARVRDTDDGNVPVRMSLGYGGNRCATPCTPSGTNLGTAGTTFFSETPGADTHILMSNFFTQDATAGVSFINPTFYRGSFPTKVFLPHHTQKDVKIYAIQFVD